MSNVSGFLEDPISCPSCGFSIDLRNEDFVRQCITTIFPTQNNSKLSEGSNNNNSRYPKPRDDGTTCVQIKKDIEEIIEQHKKYIKEVNAKTKMLIHAIQSEKTKAIDELSKQRKQYFKDVSDFLKTVESDPVDNLNLSLLLDQELKLPPELEQEVSGLMNEEKNLEPSLLFDDTLKCPHELEHDESRLNKELKNLEPSLLVDDKLKLPSELEPEEHRPGKEKKNPEPTLLDTIDVKFSGEGHVAIQDIIVVSSKGQKVIVVSDYRNSSVKCFYLDQKEKDDILFEHPPFYLTRSLDTMVAATFSRLKTIALFHVLPDLRFDRFIETQIEYSGIKGLSATTFAASRACAFRNGVIDIIDISGTVLRSFGSDILVAPYFIDIAACGRVVVSDSSEGSIFCFTSKGNIRFMYKPTGEHMLSCPRGLKCYKDFIYVVDEDKQKVIQLTDKGEYVRDILTQEEGLRIPRAIDVDNDGLMYVSIQERYIKVFSLQ